MPKKWDQHTLGHLCSHCHVRACHDPHFTHHAASHTAESAITMWMRCLSSSALQFCRLLGCMTLLSSTEILQHPGCLKKLSTKIWGRPKQTLFTTESTVTGVLKIHIVFSQLTNTFRADVQCTKPWTNNNWKVFGPTLFWRFFQSQLTNLYLGRKADASRFEHEAYEDISLLINTWFNMNRCKCVA